MQLYENVLRWWFLCALERRCIAPTLNRGCRFRGPRTHADCHRFDQSAINILLANYLADDHQAYMYYAAVRGGAVLTVMRGSSHRELISVCRSVVQVKARDYFLVADRRKSLDGVGPLTRNATRAVTARRIAVPVKSRKTRNRTRKFATRAVTALPSASAPVISN